LIVAEGVGVALALRRSRFVQSNLLLRPMWHQNSQRIQAHVFVCVLAYALWKALAHKLGNSGIKTRVRKKDPEHLQDGPQDRPMSPAVALKMLHDVRIGDILLETVEGRKLRLRRVARPSSEQAEILAALGLSMPERICADRDVTPKEFTSQPPPATARIDERPRQNAVNTFRQNPPWRYPPPRFNRETAGRARRCPRLLRLLVTFTPVAEQGRQVHGINQPVVV